MKSIALLLILVTNLPLIAAGADSSELYRAHCLSCHGEDRLGAMGPALLPQSLERLKPAEVLATIRDGRVATRMLGFANTLSESEIQELAAWLRTPPAEPPRWTESDIAASHIRYVDRAQLPRHPIFHADPKNLFVVVEGGDQHVTVLDGDKFKPIARFQSRFAVHGGPKFTEDGRFVYFASRDGWVTEYDLYSLQKVAEIRVGLNTRNLAVSSDGAWVLAGNTLPETLVLLDAKTLKPVKIFAVNGSDAKPSRVSAVYDAAPRHSFVVALKDAAELWEISYDRRRQPLDHGHQSKRHRDEAIHDYLNPRVARLDMALDDFFFDGSYRFVMAAAREGKAEVIDLDTNTKVAELALDGMPHLGSGITFDQDGHHYMATPNLNTGRVTVVDMDRWRVVQHIDTPGPGFFLRSHENTPYAWVDSMMSSRKDTLSIIDKRTLQVVKELTLRPGKTNAHVEFTRDGRYALVSIMESPGELVVVDAANFREVAALPMMGPIGKYNVYNKVTRSEGTSH